MNAIEQATLDEADRYRREGFDVIVSPTPEQRPDFAREQPFSLLARKPDINVCVAVKLQREDVDEDLIDLAKAIEQRPDWRLDLVILNRQFSDSIVRADAIEPSEQELSERLAFAELLMHTNQLPVAFLAAWSALEAVMRRRLRAYDLPVESYDPGYLITSLYANGVLEMDDPNPLFALHARRNIIAHGLDAPLVTNADVMEILDRARTLLPSEVRLAS